MASVRRMIKQDLVAIMQIEKEDKLTPWEISSFRKACRSRKMQAWVVEHKEVLGYGIVEDDACISTIVRWRIGSKQQGRGFGSLLLKTMCGAVDDCRSIEADVRANEVAGQILLSREGFHCANDIPGGYLFRRGCRFLTAPDLKYRFKEISNGL